MKSTKMLVASAILAASLAAVAATSASPFQRNEIKLSDKVSVTCVSTPAAKVPVEKADVNDHIQNTATPGSMAWVHSGRSYFCNAVLR